MKFSPARLKDRFDSSATLAEIRARLDQISLELEGIFDRTAKPLRIRVNPPDNKG